MAVTHAFGFARDLNLNCPTETSTFVHHQSPRLALTTGSQPLIGSPGRTSRTSPSVMPQLARVAAGMCPTTSKTASAAFADFATASVALSSSPIATKTTVLSNALGTDILGEQAHHSSICLLLHS